MAQGFKFNLAIQPRFAAKPVLLVVILDMLQVEYQPVLARPKVVLPGAHTTILERDLVVFIQIVLILVDYNAWRHAESVPFQSVISSNPHSKPDSGFRVQGFGVQGVKLNGLRSGVGVQILEFRV